MDGFSTNDAWNALFAVNPNSLTDRDDAVVATDSGEVDQTVIADVMDDESDLVHVTGEHDLHLGVGISDRGHVSVCIGDDLVGEGAGVLSIDLGGVLFEARRARRVDDQF